MKAPGCRGAALPIVDVTIPGRASFLDGISVTFSFMPLFLGLMATLGMFLTRRLSMLCAVLFWLILLIACEMLKGMFKGARPFGSCATSSGHGPTVVITSYAFISWMALEFVFHQPQILRFYRLGYMVCACTLLGPVPAARTRLRDHTALQLGVGIVIGLAAGLGWFLLMHFVIGAHILRWIGLLKARIKCLQFVNIKNDYFTSKEVYDEQMRRYREGGVEGYLQEEELGETHPDDVVDDGGGGANAGGGAGGEHRTRDAAYRDIHGGSNASSDYDVSSHASVVSNVDDIFGDRTKKEKKKKKNSPKKDSPDRGGGGSSSGGGGSPRSKAKKAGGSDESESQSPQLLARTSNGGEEGDGDEVGIRQTLDNPTVTRKKKNTNRDGGGGGDNNSTDNPPVSPRTLRFAPVIATDLPPPLDSNALASQGSPLALYDAGAGPLSITSQQAYSNKKGLHSPSNHKKLNGLGVVGSGGSPTTSPGATSLGVVGAGVGGGTTPRSPQKSALKQHTNYGGDVGGGGGASSSEDIAFTPRSGGAVSGGLQTPRSNYGFDFGKSKEASGGGKGGGAAAGGAVGGGGGFTSDSDNLSQQSRSGVKNGFVAFAD